MIRGDWGYVVVGYAITGVSVAVLVVRLNVRARRAGELARKLRDRQG